ncbi:hypothetical protein ABIA23_005251 [Sinorhizobium fredii]
MSSPRSVHQIRSTLRQFLDNEAAGGVVLMVAAVIAVITANSPFADRYFSLLDLYIGPISLQHWINDALMSLFFLLVGLEIKREMLDGQLSSWSRRILPGAAAAGGMLFPALVYLYFNWNDPAALGGWAIPTATDIAFALGVLSLFGNSLPVSLKIFLATLAIVDDLGAVIVIALLYTAELNYLPLAAAGIVIGNLIIFNRMGLTALWPYLSLGGLLLVLVFASGVHPTMAGIMLALTIPLKLAPGTSEAARDTSPLHKLEHYLQKLPCLAALRFCKCRPFVCWDIPVGFLRPANDGRGNRLVLWEVDWGPWDSRCSRKIAPCQSPHKGQLGSNDGRRTLVRNRLHDEPLYRTPGIQRPEHPEPGEGRNPVGVGGFRRDWIDFSCRIQA